MLKKILLILLLVCFICILVVDNSYTLNLSVISEDIGYSKNIISIYNTYFDSEKSVKKLVSNNIVSDKCVELYNNIQTENIYLTLEDILLYEDLSVYEIPDDIDINTVYVLKSESEKVSLNLLKNKEYVQFENKLIKIVDIFETLCYNNIEKSKENYFMYKEYQVKNNKLIVIFENTYTMKSKKVIFTHGLFGKLKSVEVV